MRRIQAVSTLTLMGIFLLCPISIIASVDKYAFPIEGPMPPITKEQIASVRECDREKLLIEHYPKKLTVEELFCENDRLNFTLAALMLTQSPHYQELVNQLRNIETRLAIEKTRFTDESAIIQLLYKERGKLILLIEREARQILCQKQVLCQKQKSARDRILYSILDNAFQESPTVAQIGLLGESVKIATFDEISSKTNDRLSLVCNPYTEQSNCCFDINFVLP